MLGTALLEAIAACCLIGLKVHNPTQHSLFWVAVDRDAHAGQVGGYVEVYDGLTFSTVRNAGHMVPYTQAERAFHMFSHWINGKAL